jgi:hypothetical protein
MAPAESTVAFEAPTELTTETTGLPLVPLTSGRTW